MTGKECQCTCGCTREVNDIAEDRCDYCNDDCDYNDDKIYFG